MISRAAILYYFTYLDFNENYDTCREKVRHGPYTGRKSNQQKLSQMKPDVVLTRQRLLINYYKYSERTKGNDVFKALKKSIKAMSLSPNREYQKRNRN